MGDMYIFFFPQKGMTKEEKNKENFY